jgi:hypothetical protein
MLDHIGCCDSCELTVIQVKFCGEMRKIQVWNHCVDSGNVDAWRSSKSTKFFALLRWVMELSC